MVEPLRGLGYHIAHTDIDGSNCRNLALSRRVQIQEDVADCLRVLTPGFVIVRQNDDVASGQRLPVALVGTISPVCRSCCTKTDGPNGLDALLPFGQEDQTAYVLIPGDDTAAGVQAGPPPHSLCRYEG